MATPPKALEPWLRVGELTPQEEASFAADDRRSCTDCAHKSGTMCAALKRMHVPLDLLHRCESYRQRGRR